MVVGAVAPLIIADAEADPRFRKHPVLHRFGVRSYLGVPLMRRDGSSFGTLCALDPDPSSLTEEHLRIFHLLADLIGFELEAEEERRRKEEDLKAARQGAAFRERLMAILGHDLRNPLAAIQLSAYNLMALAALQPDDLQEVRQIAQSADRIGRLTSDLLDFTRVGFGGTLPFAPRLADLRQVCEQVLQEFRLTYPEREIQLHWEGDGEGLWDSDRLAQMISNLVINALDYGDPAAPVDVRCWERGQEMGLERGSEMRLEVTNRGAPIPPDLVGIIFDPYQRAEREPQTRGRAPRLGLGLFIAQEIAQLHGGAIHVRSSLEEGTTLSVALPIRAEE